VSANFTWLYIGTQDVWCAFLIYLAFSRFGTIKLGKDDEKPRYNDFAWFAMLFTCGVAVGLYVFGVAEPLYFYRQSSTWHSWAYDYTVTKTSVENDAQRAQQAIFMAVYHWGIHGWVPYILLALLVGVVSFRWGMPMTIRSCFYPLLGDHALGLAGDFIDSLSIATTTFGVCTSLGLGVEQLSKGLGFLRKMGCDYKVNCESANGVWLDTTYGANRCFTDNTATAAQEYDTCPATWTLSAEGTTNSYYQIIVYITLIATGSVLLGLDRGIKTLASTAFILGMVVMITIFFSDNTWYLLSIMVQTTGYYLQHILQVGFDCEAFQQLGFELKGPAIAGVGSFVNSYQVNAFWGSTGSESMYGVIVAAGLEANIVNTPACGGQINPCTYGALMATVGAQLAGQGYGVGTVSDAADFLSSIRMSSKSVQEATSTQNAFADFYGRPTPVPCGTNPFSGANLSAVTHTAETAMWFGTAISPLATADPLCPTSLSATDMQKCVDAFTAEWPRCPETTYGDVHTWGTCKSFKISCPIAEAVYDDSNPDFFNWWTIFYWAWWITWAPFVGFFVALISRGRTVREVIFGGFVCPTFFAIMWFSVFGGLAIKMQRTAELALHVHPDVDHAAVTCSEHYSGRDPITPEAKRLADQGYFMLTCFPPKEQIYYLMYPYENRTQFIHFFLWLGLVIYFITSSDSGSMTDDIISASGLSASRIPSWQKIFWCFTEGLVAIGLISTGGTGLSGALKTLQRLSIIIGLPYTFLLCFMVPALYRALKKEAGDQDIIKSKRFNTQLFDILEGFAPKTGSPCPPGKHFASILTGLLVPFLPIKAAFAKIYPKSPTIALLYGAVAQLLWLAWIVLVACEGGFKGLHSIGWLCFMGFNAIVIFTRIETRRVYNVWGSVMDDFFVGLFLWPFVLAQVSMCVETDNKDAQTYFQTADELRTQMEEHADEPGSLPTISKPEGVVSATA
jgi:choline-glycine betaine transporter